MSQLSSSRQQILNLLASLVKDRQLHKMSKWLLCCAIVAIFWWFNWKLFLATSIGIALMSGCYLLQNPYWQRYCQKWQNFLVGSNRQLMLAVGSGATGSFCTYLAASIWADSDNQWLATGAILQGCASLTTLLVLFWSLGHKKVNNTETKIDSLLADLSHNEPLKRLIAVRQLTRLLITHRLPPDHHAQSREYFRLMLSEPQLPVVRNALLESLELLDLGQASLQKRSEIKMPIKLNSDRQPIKILQE